MTTESLAPDATFTAPRRLNRIVVVALTGGAMIAGCMVGMAGSASAATSPGSTQGNVDVTTAIALSGLTPSFTLSGVPGATVTGAGDVTMNVVTNNLAGYAVTVESATATLAPATAGNLDSIPIGALSVRETGTTDYTPLSAAATVTTHTQATRSAELGDTISNDYQVVVPFVNQDTYTTTLNYVATTL
jgi:hypothetical protein